MCNTVGESLLTMFSSPLCSVVHSCRKQAVLLWLLGLQWISRNCTALMLYDKLFFTTILDYSYHLPYCLFPRSVYVISMQLLPIWLLCCIHRQRDHLCKVMGGIIVRTCNVWSNKRQLNVNCTWWKRRLDITNVAFHPHSTFLRLVWCTQLISRLV